MYEIKYANENNLNDIASCHIIAFPDSLSSKMGINFVSNMMRWYLSSPNKFLFYIVEKNSIIGYCGGHLQDGIDAYGASSGMTQFGFSSAIIAILKKPLLLFHPELMKRYPFIFINIARKLGLKKDKPLAQIIVEYNKQPLSTGLVVIGVLPKFQKKGIGAALLNEFENKSKLLGASKILLSVNKKNKNAINAYLNNKFDYSKEHAHKDTFVMTKNI
jgi:GNAT superfamily N-acetyltransferase